MMFAWFEIFQVETVINISNWNRLLFQTVKIKIVNRKNVNVDRFSKFKMEKQELLDAVKKEVRWCFFFYIWLLIKWVVSVLKPFKRGHI